MAETRMRKWRIGWKGLGVEFDGKGRLRGQFLLWERLGTSRVERRKAKAARAKKRAALRAAQAKLRAAEKAAVAKAVIAQQKALQGGQSPTAPLVGRVLPAQTRRPPSVTPETLKAAGLCGAPTKSVPGGHCLNRGNCPHHSRSRRP